MKFLANENFPLASVQLLRKQNIDIVAIVEDSPGISDSEVLSNAVSEQRVILTFDRDYGELIYRFGLHPPAGVIYFRYTPQTPLEPGQHLLQLLQNPSFIFAGRFTVLERTQLRQRPLPE
ncbi:DUF5615 family PIN-like protein [Synechococcus sp. BDU 130192]|uniref:DUF5615 family PIN-like protein n=1 Tax=Synechococcus sp. BDU 130192 TaxID=2042059 RepID=UPI000C087D91|nr:DUF5615 family PIN-like protein [Synechococcus sp. BDU 130192]